jgi:biotin carboxylase
MDQHVLFVNATYPKKLRTLTTARRLGMRVSVVGPDLPAWAAPFVDAHIPADTYDIDETLRVVRRAARVCPFDGVVTFWDRDVVLVARLAEELGLAGAPVTAAERARDKFAARLALRDQGVPQPPFASVTSFEDLVRGAREVGFPLICKPVGASSSKGVFRVDREDDLPATYRAVVASTAPDRDRMFTYHPGRYVVEGFMEGTEVSVEGLVAGGAVHIVGVTEKWVHGAFFTEYQHAFPARLAPAVAAKVADVAAAAVLALGLDNCGFHAEVMINGDEPRIVEVNGRLGGDLITTHLVPLASGIDLTAAALAVAVGEPVDLEPTRSLGACVRFLVAERSGSVRAWTGIEEAAAYPGVVEFEVEKRVGDGVGLPPAHFADERLCYVVTVGSGTDEALSAAGEALGRVRCVIE